MDRRRTVALILALMLCLALLGSWLVRIDKEDAPAAESPTATATSNTPKLSAEIAQIPRQAANDGAIVSPQAPIGSGSFRGRVIDATTRQPIREFTVEFYLPGQPRRPEQPPLSRTFQTRDGRFDYRGLPTVTGAIHTTASGYQRFDMDNVRISENESVKEILIPMRAGHVLRGRVVDEATKDGIAMAVVSFREASVGRFDGNFRTRPSVRSRKDGSFVLEGVPPGAVRINVGAQNYASKEIEQFVSAKTPPLEVALSRGGTIAGYLAGADGLTPVEGQVSLHNLDEGVGIANATGSAGEFSFVQLKAGRYQLSGHGGGLNGQREIELSHNERLEGIVLGMNPGHSIRGVVTGLRPEELAKAYLFVFAEGGRGGLAVSSSIDERGAYEVRGIAAGPVRIQANSDARGVVSKAVQMPTDGDLTVNLEFKSGARLSGRVTTGGKPLAATRLLAHSRTAEDQNILSLSPIVTSMNGEYSFEDVPDGEYVVMIESYASPTVRVSGDTVFDIEMPEVQLSGHVFEEGGRVPVVGTTLNVRPAQPRSLGYALGDSSNNFGQFGIRGMQPGDFVLTAYKAGYELYRAPLSYGSPISDMTIYMRPARGVELKVREAGSNKAIERIMVVENVNGVTGLVVELHADRDGIGYLPEGLAGSSLTFSATGYHPIEVIDWNGQQLDLSLQREPSR